MVAQKKMSDFYTISKKLLTLCALWIEEEDDRWKIMEYIKKWIWSYLVAFLFLSSVTMDMILRSSSIEKWADASYYVAMQLSYVLKVICFRLKYDVFKFLVLGDHKLKNDNNIPHVEKFLKNSNFVTIWFLTNCYVNGFFMCLWPMIESTFTKELNLPMNGWFPWNVKDSFSGKMFAYFLQVIGLISGITINGSLDMLVVQLLLASCWQVRLLKNNLQSITRDLLPEEIVKKLIDCTKHYLSIIRYVELVEDVFGSVLFIQFLASGCGLCATGIEIIVMPVGTGRFYSTIGYLMALIIQISAYCWAGQQLITESEDMMDSCYNMDWWYGGVCSKEAKILLFLMMERSKKPISIRAGRFFPLSVFTLAAIFRTSYSYFAVLQRMHTKNQAHQL